MTVASTPALEADRQYLIALIEDDAWLLLDGWKILYGDEGAETLLARAAIANTVSRLPAMLNGLL